MKNAPKKTSPLSTQAIKKEHSCFRCVVEHLPVQRQGIENRAENSLVCPTVLNPTRVLQKKNVGEDKDRATQKLQERKEGGKGFEWKEGEGESRQDKPTLDGNSFRSGAPILFV